MSTRHHSPVRPTLRLFAYVLLFLSGVSGCGAIVVGQTISDLQGEEYGTAPEPGQGLLIALAIAAAGALAWYLSDHDPRHP